MSRPLRIAVVGAGPAGFFATAELLKQKLDIKVDLFDRLPTPYGLVRHGVAPDHQKIKAIADKYGKDAEAGSSAARLRMFGHVEIGKDITVAELQERYDAIVFAFGAQSNRRLGIPGEELECVHPASVFVGWYNGHPDCVDARYNFGAERAVIVGVGNVALDVARVLAKSVDALAETDISDHAIQALRENHIQQVVLLGRHTAAQAAFTPAELEEFAGMPGCDFVVSADDRKLDPRTVADRAAGTLDARVARNLEIIEKHALLEPRPGRRSIVLRFFSQPIEILGAERIEALRIGRNRLVEGVEGEPRFEPSGEVDTLPCQILLRSVGYKVEPIPGIPFDEKSSTIPHERGQILTADDGEPVPGFFVTGWAKRGPSGVIGTNKPDAVETIQTLLAVFAAGKLKEPRLQGDAGDILGLLKARDIRYVDFEGWKLLNKLEIESGKEAGRPRRKFVDVATMLSAIGQSKMSAVPHDTLVSVDS